MDADTTFILLAPRELHSIPDAAGVRVTCRAGVVWITVDGDEKDYVLEKGESFVSSEHARVLVYALGAARIDVAASRHSTLRKSTFSVPELARRVLVS